MHKNNYYRILIVNSKLKTYKLINLIFAGIIIVLFVYSGNFYFKNMPKLSCIHYRITGQTCNACGLSRGFTEIMRGNFRKAQEFNANSMYVFSFFLIQLCLRISLTIISNRMKKHIHVIVAIDVVLSLILFFSLYLI